MSATGEPWRADRGTTLVEALAVVTITTLASLILFPRLHQGYLALAQRQVAADIAAQLRQTRAAAMRGDAPVAFIVQAQGRQYGPSSGRASETPPGLALSLEGGDANRIVFYGDGSSSGGAVRVWARGRSKRVSVDPIGGAVESGT